MDEGFQMQLPKLDNHERKKSLFNQRCQIRKEIKDTNLEKNIMIAKWRKGIRINI